MATVYVETPIPSYLTAWTSRDLVRAAHQQITREWWQTAPSRFQLYVSEAVIEEIALGDPKAAADRQLAVKGISVLTLTDAVLALAREYDTALRLPLKAATDVLHIAFAVAYEIGLPGHVELPAYREWAGNPSIAGGERNRGAEDAVTRHPRSPTRGRVMNDDPVVEEVHRSREILWEKCGRDWQKLAEYLRAREAEHPERVLQPHQVNRREAKPAANSTA